MENQDQKVTVVMMELKDLLDLEVYLEHWEVEECQELLVPQECLVSLALWGHLANQALLDPQDPQEKVLRFLTPLV